MSEHAKISDAIVAAGDRIHLLPLGNTYTAIALLLGHLATISEDAPLPIAERLLIAVDRILPPANPQSSPGCAR